MSAPDTRIDEALDLVRGAMVSLKTALRLIGESRAQAVEQEQEKGPKYFGRKQRPTTAVGAESQQSEG